ncbi:MAG: hypothetical protein INQ03_08870 [Candidatus Heimdallarchaeota archaeon]|nr:hypothetical protein [Candidatus Heimdallarchaeota archaeon]
MDKPYFSLLILLIIFGIIQESDNSDEICIVKENTIAYSRGDRPVLLVDVSSATVTDGFEYLGSFNSQVGLFCSIPIVFTINQARRKKIG